MMQGYATASDDDPDLSEVCLVGGDLTEFNTKRIGSGLRRIDLSFNMIQRVKGLESSADTLEEVIFDNNRLHRIELRQQFPKLHTLSLNKNMITDFLPLVNTLNKYTPTLRHLSLLGNPACPDQLTMDDVDESDYQKYRYFVLNYLPGLRFLDHRPVTRNEFLESQRHEHREISFGQQGSALPQIKVFISPPKSSDLIGSNKSRQGKRKYKYTGKNSEGNRFINDMDL